MDLEHLGTAQHELRLVLERSDGPSLYEELRLDGPLQFDLSVFVVGEDLLRFEGTMQGAQLLTCVRSLEPFTRSFEVKVHIEVQKDQTVHEQVLEDEDEDEDLFRFRIPALQESVEISECVRQLVVLQEPINPVKDPAKDFVWTDLEGDSIDAAKEDPRWEKLKELKQKLNKPQ